MRKSRKRYTAQEKVAILRRHLVEKEPVSKLCDELKLQPTVFYRWQKEFFENGAAAFENKPRNRRPPEQERITRLEQKIQTKDEVLAELMAEHVALKKALGRSERSMGCSRHSRRDRRFRAALVREDRDQRRATSRMAGNRVKQVLPLAQTLRLAERTQRLGSAGLLVGRVGKASRHRLLSQASVGRLSSLDVHDARRRRRGGFAHERLARAALAKWSPKPSLKGQGFKQPLKPHQHWHLDVSYINVSGTFYYLASVLDGCSRAIVEWSLRESMKESDIEVLLQAAEEKHPQATPRVTSDNGPQLIAAAFKEFIRISGMTHVRTSPYYPQSKGKLERWHKSLKNECIRPGVPLTLDDAQRLIGRYVEHYNGVRLHSAIGFVTPADMLAGRREAIHAARDSKLEAARERRRSRARAA